MVSLKNTCYISDNLEAANSLWILAEACRAEMCGSEVDFIASDPKHIKQFNKKYGVSIDEPTLTRLFTDDHQEATKYIHLELAKVGKKASNIVSCQGKLLKSEGDGIKVYSYIRIGILPVHPKHISLANVSDEQKEYLKKLNKNSKVKSGRV